MISDCIRNFITFYSHSPKPKDRKLGFKILFFNIIASKISTNEIIMINELNYNINNSCGKNEWEFKLQLHMSLLITLTCLILKTMITNNNEVKL